jgi:hypothetical protein
MSAGSRSDVNWTRWKPRPRVAASAWARVVLPQVAVRQQRHEGQPHLLRLAEDQGVHLRLRAEQGLAERIG